MMTLTMMVAMQRKLVLWKKSSSPKVCTIAVHKYRFVIYDSCCEFRCSSLQLLTIHLQGTPICGYARGYFADEAEEDGDKSVGFLFAGENVADVTAVFYNKQLMTLSDALWTVYQERGEEGNTDTSNLLFGHCVQISNETGVSIQADTDFMSRIFIPDVKEEDKFSPTSLGIYANDLAFDPDSNEEQYFENSERNNILQLVWRLAKDEKTGMVVPTWPVVVTKQDIRFLNTVPMEVGLQYGFNYWNAVLTEGASKYIK
uniref:Uncharacterized protein n=1 Tax=Skeletonema marinoi TaxID=267567 RepID=A0A7S2LS25_9STRA|mmetsp:Transcript_28828/g.49063  ORF Transcript_28828/g.49063 Transcript_28828/m.49063 type:complete len:258 (+) Transcript_28828:335-1108(+)